MTKDELLKHIDEMIKIEESVVPVYSRHVGDTLFLSGFPEEKRKKIVGILNQLREDSRRHEEFFAHLRQTIREDARDVF